MTRAYDESYLNDAAENLGDMLVYAVHDCGYDADEFFGWFILSGLAGQFGSGNPKYIAGLSGVELAREVVFRTSGVRLSKEATQDIERDAIYWSGWALAQYQWFSGLRFSDLVRGGLTIRKIQSLYVLHEADISKFMDVAEKILASEAQAQPTRLKCIRKARGFTQQELSEASGVTLRMIQLYEQRRNKINEASVMAVVNLANALGCQPVDLMEPVQ